MKSDSMRNDIWKWLSLLIIAVFSIYVTFPVKDKLRFGLDLKGGTSFTGKVTYIENTAMIRSESHFQISLRIESDFIFYPLVSL